MKRVLALQHIWDNPPAYLEEILCAHAIVCDTVEVQSMPIPDLAPYQAIVLMGGPQHLYTDEDQAYLERERDLLRQAVAASIPTLGICLGGQLLASSLGARVYRHQRAELGFFEIPLTAAGCQDPLFAGLPGWQLAFHWHEDVFDLPEGAVLLASNAQVPNQAFRYGPCAYGLQFHIELNAELAQLWLGYPPFAREIAVILDDEAAPARLIEQWGAQSALYQDHTRRLFENFLRIAGLI
ncbi:MAG TPA: type 1 glutamine amidotransferase [Ktedonobacteraceae bacterium]|jgi:GMP synthase-like glutamine amidotransferase